MIDVELRERLAAAAAEPDRGGLTRAGRQFHKHGSRAGSVYPPPSGGPEEMNRRAQAIVEAMLDDPGSHIETVYKRRHGGLMDIWATGRESLRYSEDGRFIGFLEPKDAQIRA